MVVVLCRRRQLFDAGGRSCERASDYVADLKAARPPATSARIPHHHDGGTMTALMRNPLVWHGATGILLILGFVFGGSILGAVWAHPGLVALVLRRLAAPRGRRGPAPRRRDHRGCSIGNAAKIPRIDGTVAATEPRPPRVDPDDMAAFLGKAASSARTSWRGQLARASIGAWRRRGAASRCSRCW